jgi:predicted acetyltransferase
MPKLELIIPSEKYLASYLDALTRGWSPDNIRGAEAAAEEIVETAQGPARFIAPRADDREAKGGPVKMPDGSTVERLPGFNRWLWDREFCGSIGFRWQPATAELPPHVLGHIGFSVLPWKRGRKYATKALGLMLKETQAEGLPSVQLVPDSDNIASQKVILSNGGRLIEEFRKPAQIRCRSLLSALSHCAFSLIRCGAFSQDIRLNTKHGGFADEASLRNRRQPGRLLGSSRLSVSRGFRWRFHYRQGRISR